MEDHNHWCVDEYIHAIKNECNRILKAWRSGLSCKAVKNAGEVDSLVKLYEQIKHIADVAAFMAWGD